MEDTTTNQGSALAVKGNLERWHAGGGGRWETLSHHLGRQMEQRKNNEKKYIGGPKHNNQPKTGGRGGGEHGGDMQRVGRVREVRCHHFGGIVSWIGG